jgi:phosphoglycolate phosphatase-like HAD superfamily hydrolase
MNLMLSMKRLGGCMSDLRTAALQALEALEMQEDGRADAKRILRAALVEDAMQKFTDVNQELEAALAEPPPEAQTEAEKVAYCAGWWDALEKKRAQRDELLEVVRDAITTLDRSGYPTAAAELRDAVAKHS